MKTITTYAAKAKQFLNLLQGYTKGIRLTAILILLLMGVSNAWAGYNTHWKGNVFFRVPDEWNITTYDEIQISVTRTTQVSGTAQHIEYLGEMERVGNTRLYYIWVDKNHSTWDKTEYVLFTANTNLWSSNNITISANSQYTTPINYDFTNSEYPYLYNPTSEGNGAAVTGSYSDNGNTYEDRRKNLLQKKQTINLYTNETASNTGGSVKISGTYITGNTTTGTSDVTSSGNDVSYDNLIGATVKLTATPTSGYEFDGWYTEAAGGTAISTSATYTYTCKGELTLYARFSAKTYTVTLDNQGATTAGATSVTATYGSAMPSIASNLPKKTGYTFKGYYDATSGGTQYYKADGTSAKNWDKTSNTILYAQWTPNTFTITYKDQGNVDFSGTHESGYPTTHTYGTATTLKTASKTGYTFGGWYKESACTGTAITSLGATAYTDKITLYAKWTPVPTLEISTNQQYLRTGKDKLQLNIEYANIPDGHCYRVKVGDGYYTGNAEGASEYRVAISGDGSVEFKSNGFLRLGEQTIIVELWTESPFNQTSTSSNSVTVTVEQEHQVAVYAYLDGVRSEAGGRITSATPIFPAAHIEETITASQPNPGYYFVNWTASNGNIKFTDPNSLSTTVTAIGGGDIYANYTETKHNVTIQANNNTYGTVSSESISVGQHTASSTITANPKSGCRFVNWTATPGITIANVTRPSTTITATQGGTLTANFEENKYAVQVSVAAGQESWGSVSTNSTSVGSVSAQQITATANTNLGYEFDHWEVSGGITITSGNANNATIKITATKDGSLTAHFRGENRPQNVYLIGTMNSWKQSDADWRFYKLPGESGSTVTLTKTINKSDYHDAGYEFGINIYHSDWNDKHWKNSSSEDTKMTAHNCTGWKFGTKDGDKKTYIDLSVSGEYTFTLTNSDIWDKQALSITYPDKSFIEGDFATAWNEEAYPLVEDDDIQTVTIPITSKKDIRFRLVSHGKVFGTSTKLLIASNSQTLSTKNMKDDGAVMIIGAYVEGDYTFSYNKSKKVLTVTYPSVNQLQVYSANPAHDAAKKNWDWDSQNGNVYTKTLSLNANTTYTFKAVVNSDFYGKNETTLTRKNPSSTLSTEGDDVTITTDIAGNYTFTFNASTKALSVTYPEAYTFTYGIGTNSKGLGTVAVTPDIASGTLVAAGTDLKLSATPNLGYKFVGWYSEAACTNQVSTANPYNFPINSTTTLYAKFEKRDLYIHTDIIWDWGTAPMIQDEKNKAIYTYTTTLEPKAGSQASPYNDGYHFHFVNTEADPNGNIAYNWYGVQTPTFEGASIDGVHLTFSENPTIQFGLTRKSDVTITLTLQSANDDPKPTVRISAIPYYNITLDQTGCAQPGTQTVEVKSGNAMPEILLPGAPTGYNFGGYYDQKDGAGKKYYNADGTSANTWDKNDDGTLYAQWTPTNYTITYNLNGGSGTMTPTSYTIESETFFLPDNPTKTGYTFAGWYANAEFTGEAVTRIEKGSTGDKAYWAKWDVASYTITFNAEGGSGGTSTLDVQYGAQLDDITIPTKAGHLFLGYYDGTGTQYYDANGKGLKKMPANNITLYAKWLDSSDCIFFYNNLGWSNVYVYFYSTDKYWDDSKGTGSNKEQTFPQEGDAEHKPHYLEYRGQMTKIEGTSIWYYNRTVHGDITRDNYTTVAFTKDQQYNYEFFNNTEVVRRGDFNSNIPMFVSMKKDARIMNQNGANKSTYYNYGYWMNYPTNTGYKLHIFDESGNKISDQLVDIPFEYGDNMIMPWSVNVSLEGAMTYAFKIQRADDVWYGNNGTMTTGSSGDVGQTAWEFTTGTDNCKITTTAPGTYVFTLNYDKDAHSNYNYLVGVEYPASVGDYRLAYKDNAHPFHPGHLLKKRVGKDTVSFFVHYNESPVIMLQKVTNIDANTGAITWTTQKTYALTANQAGSEDPGQAMLPGRRRANEVILHIGGESLDGVDLTGIYNFVLEQTADEATLQGSATKYDGDFYIRTNSAIGGWGDFRQAGNKMTYSSYAKNHSDFNHYFVEWINAGTNVKFTIANDYSYCISDTLDADNIIQKYGVSQGCLPESANVRFGWDSRNNKLTRAYIAGSGFVGDRFLVVTGNDLLKDADGHILDAGPQGNTDEDKKDPRYKLNANEDIFKDLGNWVYQVDVTAQNGTMINLTALYNGTIQYFKGAEGDPSYPLLASTNVGKEYKIRMIYNFKTNHLVVAWMPESPYDVQGAEQLGTDMLLIRSNQGQATQIQLNSGAETINNINTAYAVMTFTKTFVEDDKKPIHERKHYWVSFPFDVKISDVFGFSEYKDHWIMQAYDGAGRAANGLWADTDTYWRYITNNNFVMRKGQGYLLTLDVKKMLELDPVFANTEEVSLYFPSRGKLETITSDLPTAATVPAHTCTIERENRKIYDSHWNMIGVPGFADIANFNTDAPDKYLQELEYQGDSLSFYYAYIPAENSYEVRTGATTFQSMYSYMVQFAGTINWTTTPEVEYNPQLAARRNSDSNEPEKLTMRLEIAQGEEMADQTFVQLQQEGATPEFDMNLDLTKIINSGANIYTLVGNSRIQTAGNALPMDEAMVVPVGVKIDAEGEYTFRMPDGTEGMVVELVDYETNNRTNLLLSDYIVTLPKGTSENRFALHIQPQKDVVTSLENIGEGVNNGEAVNKYLIDGKLIIRTADGVVYDAQGKRL